MKNCIDIPIFHRAICDVLGMEFSMIKNQNDYQEYRQLWRAAFGDTEMYMDYYFAKKAPQSEIWENRQDGQLCAMAFVKLYDAVLKEVECRLPYIVGVATREDKRHEGRMTQILTEGLAEKQKQGYPLAFLSPADTAIYEPLGFIPAYQRQSTIFEGKGHFSLQVKEWSDLTAEEKQQTSEFAERQLQKEAFDLYLKHSVCYYEEINRELQALQGALLVFLEGCDVVGTANWIREEGKHEVTELICQREKAERVLESLQAHVHGKVIVIEDSMFLSHLPERNGILRQQQKHPYLMYRTLQDSCPTGLSCYINDIT